MNDLSPSCAAARPGVSPGDLVLSGARKLAVWAAVLLIIGFNTLLLLQVARLIRD